MNINKDIIQIIRDITHDPKIVKLYYLVRKEGVIIGLCKLPVYTKMKLNLIWVDDLKLINHQRMMTKKINYIKSIYASVEFVNKSE